MSTSIGSCLCGEVSYELSGNMGIFQYCHCSRCRKFSGSAHSASLFVIPDQFKWLSGAELVGRYEPADSKHFATSFCKKCGSSLPWLTKTGKAIVIPAGTLNDDPGIRPTQNLFCDSGASWYVESSALPKHAEMPKK